MKPDYIKRAGILNLVLDIFLFLIELFAGIISNSTGIVSDAINSFTDILTHLLIYSHA